MPRLDEALKKRGKELTLLATAITSASQPHTEQLLRTAARLGVRRYRLGFWQYDGGKSIPDQLAEVGAQVGELDCACVQVDEANIPGNPEDSPLAAEAINRVLDAVKVEKAVHFCFGNYGGQTIQRGAWAALLNFLNSLHADHLVLELAHRPASDLDALKELDSRLGVGLGVVDIKVNQVETPEEIARAIERAEKVLGAGRVRYVHPDCGFWMLKRSVADRKIAALAKGRDLYLGRK